MIKIVLDAMGGDFYPDANIKGAILAVKSFNIHVILVGNKDILTKKLASFSNYPKDKISIHHSNEVIKMTDSPTKAFRKKKNSSIHVGLELVKEKYCI